MGKGLNIAAAVLSGALACTEAQEQEVIDQRPETFEIDPDINTCVVYAHDRAEHVCSSIFCGEFLLRDVEEKIAGDCEDGIVPEPGSDIDTCDQKGFRRGARAYFHAGQLGHNFDGIRDAGYVRCLEETEIAAQPRQPTEAKLAQADTPGCGRPKIQEPLNLPDGIWSTSMIVAQKARQDAVEAILQNTRTLPNLRSFNNTDCKTEAAMTVDQFIEKCVRGVSGCTARQVTEVFENSLIDCATKRFQHLGEALDFSR